MVIRYTAIRKSPDPFEPPMIYHFGKKIAIQLNCRVLSKGQFDYNAISGVKCSLKTLNYQDVFLYLKIANPKIEAANKDNAAASLMISGKLDPFRMTLLMIFTK